MCCTRKKTDSAKIPGSVEWKNILFFVNLAEVAQLLAHAFIALYAASRNDKDQP